MPPLALIAAQRIQAAVTEVCLLLKTCVGIDCAAQVATARKGLQCRGPGLRINTNTCTTTTMSAVSFLDDVSSPCTSLTLEEFTEPVAAHQRAEASLGLAAARLEAAQMWALDGSVSMKQWMQTHCRMTATDAGRFIESGRFLDRFPSIAEGQPHRYKQRARSR